MADDILKVGDKLRFGGESSPELDFLGRANLWIRNFYDNKTIDLARYVIAETLRNSAPGQLSVAGFDGDLTGIFAPFAALAAGESKTLELLLDMKDLEDYLNYLKQHIQAVQNVIQARNDSLIDFRKAISRPIESYILVVLSLDMGVIEARLLVKLATLMRKGPSAGVSFLIISTTIMDEMTVDAIAQNITVLSAEGKGDLLIREDQRASYSSRTAQKIIESCDSYVKAVRDAALPIIQFSEVNDVSSFWGHRSDGGLTFAIGKYGVNDVEITLGDEISQRHNMLITGAVGQGKSNLISVIIHSLCQNYSPKELSLYLLDFKEGVTLKPFANIGQDEYLPHAKTLGLESDVDLGIAVLEFLFLEYKRRLKLFKDKNKRSIFEYRQAFPEEEMPRIVVIIDEFQLMLGDDNQTGNKVADLLEKSVRLFRAAGIHFILASQTIGGNLALSNKQSPIFSQIPIRIAHKNSVAESILTLGQNNPMAAFLRAREAIVNLDYGEVSQNRKTVIAFADENVLAPLRKKWWVKARTQYGPPYVFESERRITISRGTDEIARLRNLQATPTALVGEKISINKELVKLPLPNETGRNIAIIGAPDEDCNNAIGMIQSIAVSLAVQHPEGDARFLYCDFQGDEASVQKRYPAFADSIQSLGFSLEEVPRSQFQTVLQEAIDQSAQDEASEKVYAFGIGMDRWEYEKDPYGQSAPLKTIVESGPGKGVHFIGWWVKESSFTGQTAGFGNSDAFNTKLFLRINERSVQSLAGPFVRWTAAENRALACDEVEFSSEFSFIPYAPVTPTDAGNLKTKVWDV